MALKLDMSKAFDRVEWSCLEHIRINGVPQGRIVPSRGLRQGDPLSPYLFLLCAESLSALIHRASDVGTLRGLQVCKCSPLITHHFADDSLLFCNATTANCEEIQRPLKVYERATGQQVNRQKNFFILQPQHT